MYTQFKTGEDNFKEYISTQCTFLDEIGLDFFLFMIKTFFLL